MFLVYCFHIYYGTNYVSELLKRLAIDLRKCKCLKSREKLTKNFKKLLCFINKLWDIKNVCHLKKDVPWQIFRRINVPNCFRSLHFIFLKLLGNLWLKYNLELLSIKANISALEHPKPFAEIQICLLWEGTKFIWLET